MSGGAPQLYAPSIEQQAVRDRGHASNVLVAAAGSGKTRVLTWLYCDAHLQGGIALEALLAITFTEKAAGELRTRIAVDLGAAALGRAPDLSDAWIGTFHGICARILREFAHRRGLDPAFGVLEELQALELQAEAWEEAVKGLLEAHGGAAGSLLAQVGDTALRLAVVAWWTARRSAGEVHPELPTPRTTPDDVAGAADRLVRACDAYGGIVEGIQSDRVATGKAAAPSLTERLEIVAAMAAAADEAAAMATAAEGGEPWDPIAVEVTTGRLERSTPRRGRPMPSELPEHDALVEARDGLVRRLAEAIAAPRVLLLADLVGRFSRAYEACKRRGELLDFDDLELEALQLLREDDDVRSRLVARFERVLVDEFQDTNPRQAELVDLLAGGPMWIPVGGDGRPAVTVVGDPRQAIYGFRYADVGLIAGATERINEGGELRLTTNYRSDAEVLSAVDEAFAKLDPDHEPVTAFRGPDHLPAGQARVELLVTKEEPGTKDDPLPVWADVELGARPGEKTGPSLAEARLLAGRIQALRAAEPDRSIVVLARARSVLGPIAEALLDLEIPALIDGAEGFWERLEVADVMAWLRLVRNPADDAALVAVCASPLIGLSLDGLASVGLLERADGSRARVDALRLTLEAREHFGADDRRRLVGLLALLDRQRAPGRAADPAGLVDELLLATAYDEHLLGLIGGDRRLANLVRLRRLAAELAAGGGDLTDVVERAEREQGHELRAPEAAVAGGDAVVLMTVHQAKGLEFDTVIVAGLGSPQRVSAPALLGDATRLGLRLRPAPGAPARPLFDYDELVDDLRTREDDELRRVLYVALTRARERLIVSGVARWSQKGSPFSREPSKTSPVLSWLAPAMVPELESLVEAASQHAVRTPGGIHLQVSTPEGPVLAAADRAPEAGEAILHVGEGPRLDALPDVTPPRLTAPGALSYSALAAHAACGLRFQAERVLGLPPSEPPAIDAPAAEAAPPAAAPATSAPAPAAAAEATPAVSFASAKAPAEQPDLFSFLDEPVLQDDHGPLPEKPEPVQSGLFSGTSGVPQPVSVRGGLFAATHVAPAEGPTPGEFGTAVHELLERLGPGAGDAALDAALHEATADPAWDADPARRAEVRALVAAGLRSPVVAALWAGGEPRREVAFTVALGAAGRLLTGVIDAFGLGPDGSAVVVDYKTDRLAPGDDLARKTAERYTVQREAYALAALRAGATSVRVVHLFLRAEEGGVVERTWVAGDAPALEASLSAAVGAVHEAPPQATASPDRWTCERCPAAGTLCGWPARERRRPPGLGPAPREAWTGAPTGVRAA